MPGDVQEAVGVSWDSAQAAKTDNKIRGEIEKHPNHPCLPAGSDSGLFVTGGKMPVFAAFSGRALQTNFIQAEAQIRNGETSAWRDY